MNKIVALIVIVSTCFSCQKEQSANKLKAMDWLIGSWENKSEFGEMQEHWEKVNDSVYKGSSYFIKGKDTLHQEGIALVQKGELVLYIPTVKGQNNDKPVTFQMTKDSVKQFVFENPKHDYPQKIVYHQITKDSLVAVISGQQQGKPSSDRFSMKRK